MSELSDWKRHIYELEIASYRATVRALRDERDRARTCLGFFASVIKSGEPWTETCEREYRAALEAFSHD